MNNILFSYFPGFAFLYPFGLAWMISSPPPLPPTSVAQDERRAVLAKLAGVKLKSKERREE